MSVSQVNLFLSILVVGGQIFSLLLLGHLVFRRNKPCKFGQLISKQAIPLAFVVALVATLGSLYYSEIAQFTPCKLCWLQRIFIYPQTLILALAWWKKDRHVIDYSLSMVLFGGLISLYHNYIYYAAKPSLVCSITELCVQKYVVGLGYITIPLMALTALVLIGLLLINGKISNNKYEGLVSKT